MASRPSAAAANRGGRRCPASVPTTHHRFTLPLSLHNDCFVQSRFACPSDSCIQRGQRYTQQWTDSHIRFLRRIWAWPRQIITQTRRHGKARRRHLARYVVHLGSKLGTRPGSHLPW